METANCKCSSKRRNLVVCIDGTSNQFGEQNTNVVELYSKILKTEDSGQLTYYNSGIGTYAKPSWKSFKYMLQVVDNSVDLAIAWNFEKIIIGAYRWLSDNYQEQDRIFLFGFSRGAYQVRALAGMIQRVGLIHKGNEEQIPFAYELYATHNTALATRFKATFSRENVQVHFAGVWDTVSSVGIVRGKSLPLTDSADHVCFFRHALALDERRVKFLPEYVHGGVCQKSTAPERPEAQIQETVLNPSPHIKEVWFPGTHSDIGGGNQLNRDLDLGRTPFLWMSFEAVSCGLRLRPTRVEWRWDHLHDMKESLTGVWHVFEWLPFKRPSYKDESSTIYRLHRGRGRKIKPGQKLHSSIAFCDESYSPKANLPASERRCLNGLIGKGSRLNREWVKGWEDLIEMDIFDISLMSNVIATLKSGTGSESNLWVYRLTAMTSTEEGQTALCNRPNISNDLVHIFTHSNQPEVQECVIMILEKSSEGHASVLLSSEHRLWLLRVAREKSDVIHRSFAIKLLANSLSNGEENQEILDEDALGTLDEMARDEQQHWVTDGAFAMFTTVLSQNVLSKKQAANTLAIIRTRFTGEDTGSQNVAKRLFGAILQSAENRQHLFDSYVLHFLLTKIDDLDETERSLFTLFLVNQYEYLPNEFFTLLTSKLCEKINDHRGSDSRYNLLLVLEDTCNSDGLRKRIWNDEIFKVLRQAFNQVGFSAQSLALRLYRKSIINESLLDELFDTDAVRALGHALYNSDANVRSKTVEFFVASVAQEGIRDKIFDTEIVAALRRALGDKDFHVRRNAVEIFNAAMAQEGFRDKIFNTNIVTALRRTLGDNDPDVRSGAVEIFTAAIAGGSFPNRVLRTEIVTALRGALGDKDIFVRSGAVGFFIAAIAHEGFLDKILNTKIIAALGLGLCDKESDIRSGAVKFFTAVIAQEGFPDRILNTEIVAGLGRVLGDIEHDSEVRSGVVEFFTAAIAQGCISDGTLKTKIVAVLGHALGDKDVYVRRGAVEFFIAAAAHEGFPDKILNTEIIAALGRALWDEESEVRSGALIFFTAVIAQGDFHEEILGIDILTALVRALGDEHLDVKSGAVNFFTALIADEGIRDKISVTEIVAALGRALGDAYSCVRSRAVDFLTAAIAQEGIRDKIFDNKVVVGLGYALGDKDSNVRSRAVELFAAAIAQGAVSEGFPNEIWNTKIVAALRHALDDENPDVRSGAVEFFTAAIAREGVSDMILKPEIVSALGSALGDKDVYVRSGAVGFFTTVMAHEGFPDKIWNTKIVAALGHALRVDDFHVRSSVVQVFTAAIVQEGLRDMAVNTEIVTVLGRALDDKDPDIRNGAVAFFTAAIAQAFSQDIHTEIFAGDFPNNLLSTGIVAALGRALRDKEFYVRSSALNFFTSAIAQEGFHDKIFGVDILTALVSALGDEDFYVRRSAVEFCTAALAHEGFHDMLLTTHVLTALVCALYHDVISGAIDFFTTAIAQEGFPDKLFGKEFFTALVCALGDEGPSARRSMVTIFNAAIDQEGFRDKIFNPKIITALGRALGDEVFDIRSSTVKFFTAALDDEGFRDKIFNPEIITEFGRALSDKNYTVRSNSIGFFIAAIAQEGIRDKIFNTEIITALRRALSDSHADIRSRAVDFFTAAIAQEAFRDKIFDITTVAPFLEAELMVKFLCRDYILRRAYNNFITSTLCEQLTSADPSLRDQTCYFISEAIKYDDVHARICTVELRTHFYCSRHPSSA